MKKEILIQTDSTLSLMPAKEIKEINKILKRAKLKPLTIGKKALSHCKVFLEEALNIANIQEATGYTMIFQAHHHADNTPHWKIFAKTQSYELPAFALQRYDIFNDENGIEQKNALIKAVDRLLHYFQNEISLKNKKSHTHYEKALLKLKIKPLCSKYAILKKNHLTPYQFLRLAVAHYLFKTDGNFKAPCKNIFKAFNIYDLNSDGDWLLITKDKKGNLIYIHGESQQHLIAYLNHSDYVEHHRLKVDPRINITSEDEIVEDALFPDSPIEAETPLLISQQQALIEEVVVEKDVLLEDVQQELMEEVVIEKDVLLEDVQQELVGPEQLITVDAPHLVAIKEELITLENELITVNSKGKKNKKAQKQFFKATNQKIAKIIDAYPEHKQNIPLSLLECYMNFIEQQLNKNKHGRVLDEQMNTLGILLENCKELNVLIQEKIIKSYLNSIETQIGFDLYKDQNLSGNNKESMDSNTREFLRSKYECLNEVKDHLKSDAINAWLEEISKHIHLEKKEFSMILIKKIAKVKDLFSNIIFKTVKNTPKPKEDAQEIV